MSRKRASAQSAPWASAVEERGGGQQGHRDRGADGQAEHRVAQAVVVGAGEHEETDVGDPHGPVGECEDEGEVAEGLGHAERDDQQRRHRPEHDQPHRALLGVEHAGQPGVADPGPPEHAQHQQALGQPFPGGVVRHQRRALGQGQDEDEVEEELQWRHPLAFAQRGAEAGAAFSGTAAIAAILTSDRGWLVASGVFGVVAREQRLLLVALGEAEEDEGAAEQDGDDAGRVGPLVALQEGGSWRRR